MKGTADSAQKTQNFSRALHRFYARIPLRTIRNACGRGGTADALASGASGGYPRGGSNPLARTIDSHGVSAGQRFNKTDAGALFSSRQPLGLHLLPVGDPRREKVHHLRYLAATYGKACINPRAQHPDRAVGGSDDVKSDASTHGQSRRISGGRRFAIARPPYVPRLRRQGQISDDRAPHSTDVYVWAPSGM